MKKSIGKNADGSWNGMIHFTFDDGVEAVTFDSSRASAECEQGALAHGWLARLGDSAALSRKQKDGSVITITEAMRQAEVKALAAHYESGTQAWEMRSTQRAAAQNPTILAIAAKRGCTYAEAETFLANQFLDSAE